MKVSICRSAQAEKKSWTPAQYEGCWMWNSRKPTEDAVDHNDQKQQEDRDAVAGPQSCEEVTSKLFIFPELFINKSGDSFTLHST